MTSFGRRLAAEFEQEFSRLANEWYLEWHALARGEPIDLDDFRGGRIRLCGMRFDAIAALAYWNAAARYAQGKIEETFGLAEEEIRARAGVGMEAIAEDAAVRLRSFSNACTGTRFSPNTGCRRAAIPTSAISMRVRTASSRRESSAGKWRWSSAIDRFRCGRRSHSWP